MLLEPGAVVPVHRDVSQGPAVVLNLSVYQPPGCEYLIDLNADGSLSPITRLVPLTAGASYLINVAAYHRIENRSTEDRYALIVEGPGQFDEDQLVLLARRQNGWQSLEELWEAGLEKYLRSRGG
jgi:hypothetical protein